MATGGLAAPANRYRRTSRPGPPYYERRTSRPSSRNHGSNHGSKLLDPSCSTRGPCVGGGSPRVQYFSILAARVSQIAKVRAFSRNASSPAGVATILKSDVEPRAVSIGNGRAHAANCTQPRSKPAVAPKSTPAAWENSDTRGGSVFAPTLRHAANAIPPFATSSGPMSSSSGELPGSS